MGQLVVSRLCCKRSGRLVVNNLSFTAGTGGCLALLGPNGAGKTTSLLTISGLLPIFSGTVDFDGEHSATARAIALIPETPVVFPLLTVWQHLEFVARGTRAGSEWRKRAEGLLERFELLPARNRLGCELSKGMRQKTLIAASLLSRAGAYLFDEPMVGLDASAQRELRKLIGELSREAVVIVSTHQLELASSVCDLAIILSTSQMPNAEIALIDFNGSREALERHYVAAIK